MSKIIVKYYREPKSEEYKSVGLYDYSTVNTDFKKFLLQIKEGLACMFILSMFIVIEVLWALGYSMDFIIFIGGIVYGSCSVSSGLMYLHHISMLPTKKTKEKWKKLEELCCKEISE